MVGNAVIVAVIVSIAITSKQSSDYYNNKKKLFQGCLFYFDGIKKCHK